MNAADFLENSTYITIEEKRKIGAPREKERLISRNLGAVRSKYLLVDSPKLSPKDWERVVAVFATGQAWQFKDWPPGYSNPVELFSKVRRGGREEEGEYRIGDGGSDGVKATRVDQHYMA